QVVVANYYYDSGGTTTQGGGDGNLTLVRAYTGGTSPAQRDTIRTFDWRDPPTTGQEPGSPREVFACDKLDRVTERGVFSSVPTGIATTLADRLVYSKTFYSQRGTVYKQQTATVPTASSPVFLESNAWYDGVGRTIKSMKPNSPVTKAA